MTDLATPRQGDAVLVRAIVDHVRGSSVGVNVGNGTALVVPADIARVEGAQRVRFGACRSAEAAVLHETPAGYLMLDTAPMPIVLHRDWCEQV